MQTLRDLVLALPRRFGDRIALRVDDDTRTYGQLVDRACRLANVLDGLGLVRGDRVAVLVEDRIESVDPYLACALGGHVAVTVNRRLADPEILTILTDCDARVLVHTEGLSETVERLGFQATALTLGEGARPAGAIDGELELQRASASTPAAVVSPTDPFMVAYTSGTTGTPKGAILLHGRQLTASLASGVHFQVQLYGETAFSGSMSFPGAVMGQVYPTLLTGGAVRMFGRLDPEEWFFRMEQDRSTFTTVASPLMPVFLELVEKAPGVLDNLRTIMHGGGPAHRDVVARMVEVCGTRYTETWGMTESGGTSLAVTVPHDRLAGCAADDPLTTVGRNSMTSRVFVVDEEGLELPLGCGRPGELITECETLFAGYWNRPQETVEVLRGNRYATGDVGIIDSAGYVYLTGGRRSDMIVSGGMNVYPVEVEAVLLEHPAVADVAVFSRSHPKWGEAVTAAVQLRPGAHAEQAQLIEFTRGRLAGFKRPSEIHLVDDMPRTASLKIKKHELRTQLGIEQPGAG